LYAQRIVTRGRYNLEHARHLAWKEAGLNKPA